jgi:hypothetical protein
MIGGDSLGFRAGWGVEEVWNPVNTNTKKIERQTKGDERMIYKVLLKDKGIEFDFWQDLYPGQYVSFKYRSKNRSVPPNENARLVSFHGKPKIHERREIGWISENWQSGSFLECSEGVF